VSAVAGTDLEMVLRANGIETPKIGGDKRRMKVVLAHLDDVDQKIPIVGGSAVAALDRIEKLLADAPTETPEAVSLRAAQRAIEKRAPFHGGKNAMADAILIETYADCARDKTAAGTRFAFVTHNKNEFSLPNGNQKLPHPDLADIFSRVKSLYFINLAEALRRIEPSLVTEVMLEQSWSQEPRGLSEMLEAEDLLFQQVWTLGRRAADAKPASVTFGKERSGRLSVSRRATARRTWAPGATSSGG
jgi:hypothetical protein